MHATVKLAAILAVAASGAAFAGSAEDIIAKEKCRNCHTSKTTPKGPSWASVAAKYQGQPDAEAKLVQMLKNGGPTPSGDDHKKVAGSDADLKAVVAIVLSSK